MSDDKNNSNSFDIFEQKLAQSLAELPNLEPPSDLTDRIMARVQEVEKPRPRKSLGVYSRVRPYIPMAAASILLVMAIPLILMGGPPDNTQAPMKTPMVVTRAGDVKNYVSDEKLTEFFQTWDKELAAEQAKSQTSVQDNEPLLAYDSALSSGMENLAETNVLYDDPLSALVGF